MCWTLWGNFFFFFFEFWKKIWGKLLQLLTELVFLSNFLAADLVWLWIHYGITAKILWCYLAKYQLSSHSYSQPALSHSWWRSISECFTTMHSSTAPVGPRLHNKDKELPELLGFMSLETNCQYLCTRLPQQSTQASFQLQTATFEIFSWVVLQVFQPAKPQVPGFICY